MAHKKCKFIITITYRTLLIPSSVLLRVAHWLHVFWLETITQQIIGSSHCLCSQTLTL